jgi:hypothetical protein
MASRRTKSISAKVTEPEYVRLVAHAGDRTISEWLRTIALEAAAPTRHESQEAIVLAELLALRTIVLNLYFAASRGEPLTAEAMQRLIARADHDKVSQARERLTAMTTGREA